MQQRGTDTWMVSQVLEDSEVIKEACVKSKLGIEDGVRLVYVYGSVDIICRSSEQSAS